MPSPHTDPDEAVSVLHLIEHRTVHLVEQSRRAVQMLLAEGAREDEPRNLHTARALRISLAHLERYADAWSPLVGDSARLRAEILRLMAERFGQGVEESQAIRRALALEAGAEHGVLDGSSSARGTLRVEPAAGTGRSLEEDIEEEMSWVKLHRGQTLMREGDPADSMYIVLSGRLRAMTENGHEIHELSEIGRGETVGEVALLTEQPRSATVYAVRDTELLRLSATAFERLAASHPVLALRLARLTARRLSRANRLDYSRGGATTIAVVPVQPDVPIPDFARDLVSALSVLGRTLHLDRESLQRRLLDTGLVRGDDVDPESREVVSWLNEQETDHRFVVYQADPAPTPWTRRCQEQGDHLLLVVTASTSPRDTALPGEILNRETACRRAMVMLHPDTRRPPERTIQWLDAYPDATHYHVRFRDRLDTQRLARSIVGSGVGLVLSGGGARSIAHIGVIRALEEAHIPVDYVGGSSGGALVAAQWASGWDSDAMYRYNQELLRHSKRLRDFTFPIVSLLGARVFARLLQDMFGERQIEDLWRPFFCVSSNLTRAEVTVHRRGSVRQAVRASCGIPGILPPLLVDGELLVDGVVLDNLPVDVMSEFSGGGSVIAVDVTTQYELTQQYRFGESLSAGQLLVNRINPFARERLKAPNIASILLRSSELNSVRTRKLQIEQSHLYINPPVSRFGVLDLDAFDELVDLGYEHARSVIAGMPSRDAFPFADGEAVTTGAATR